jgi:hypothetical protein
MKSNKATGPDGIPIEFYKAHFYYKELEERFPFASKYLEIIFCFYCVYSNEKLS